MRRSLEYDWLARHCSLSNRQCESVVCRLMRSSQLEVEILRSLLANM